MFQSEAYLREVVQYLILSEIFENACLLLVFVLFLDLALHITVVGVVHDDAQLALLSLVDLAEANDIRVAQHFQDFRLPQGFLALFITHLLDINLLDDSVLSDGLTLDEIGRPERPCPQGRHLLIGLVLLLLHHNIC